MAFILVYVLITFVHVFRSVSSLNENFKAQLICTDTHMIVYITNKNQNEFTGVIYTEGSFQKEGCHLEIDNSRKVSFEVPYDSCLTKEENGVYSNVVIIQRHARILTNDDAAFLIKCDETNMHKAQVVVTETMLMLNPKKDSDGGYEEEYYKPQMKQNLYKKTKMLYNDKETITYVGSGKNSSNKIHASKY